MSTQFVYTMHRVGKVVPPKRHILKDISLSFFPGAKIGVLGLNGAGKSTLLRIMAGVDKEFEGEARPQPGIKIGYLPQEPKLDLQQTVREAVEEAVSEVKNALTRLDEVYALYADPDADFDKLAAEQANLEAIIQAHDGHNLDNQLERAADALRLPDWDAKIEHLSGGERRRVALCRLLLEKPDMLLLDEPTNHLDAESVAWLERFLHDYEGTVVAITHDRYFLDNVAGWILELDRGEHLTKSYGDRTLIDDLSFSIPKGAIVGIIGANGAGKSTLFRMLSGQEQPDSGSITMGETVVLASVDQFRDSMDDKKTVWEEVSNGQDVLTIGNFEIPSRAYVGRFNFKGVDQQKRVGELSGGERGRLHLAKLLQRGGNVLLLDEPTNDLDVETLRALENAILEFPGCAMVISHDRWFLDRIATHILDYGDEGKVTFYEGNFSDYEEWKKKTLGEAATQPHRIKYKRIAK